MFLIIHQLSILQLLSITLSFILGSCQIQDIPCKSIIIKHVQTFYNLAIIISMTAFLWHLCWMQSNTLL